MKHLKVSLMGQESGPHSKVNSVSVFSWNSTNSVFVFWLWFYNYLVNSPLFKSLMVIVKRLTINVHVLKMSTTAMTMLFA